MGTRVGISTGVCWSVSYALGLGALVLVTGCDVGALHHHDLMGAGDAVAGDTRPDSGAVDVVTGVDGADSGVRVGRHTLSGSVTDACTRRGTTARVGIAGHRQCSVDGKGAYYFDNLPAGKLALIAFKEGYKHFEVAVVITPEGTIQDIVLEPDTAYGCADPLPVDVACACEIPGCP